MSMFAYTKKTAHSNSQTFRAIWMEMREAACCMLAGYVLAMYGVSHVSVGV